MTLPKLATSDVGYSFYLKSLPGTLDYSQFNIILFCASIIGTISGFLWLVHPDLCIAKHYKITSYIVSCLRGLETFMWCAPKIAQILATLEGHHRNE
uniref:Uncharacterized protein n=1 Tax=Aegilops tauschii TaxID=37682 RepID=M8APD3_AEGTA